MSQLRHPNCVQYLGMCLVSGCGWWWCVCGRGWGGGRRRLMGWERGATSVCSDGSPRP